MFCPHCGTQVAATNRYCRSCGGNLGLPSSRGVGSYAVAGDPQAIPAAHDAEIRGVGGWLLFFCVILTVLGPIAFVSDISGEHFFLSVLRGLITIFAVVVGINLWSVSERALGLLRAYFAVAAVYGLLLLAVTLFSAFARPEQNLLESIGRPSFRLLKLAFLAAWYAYFHSSRRVRSTYGSNL
jgi:zinc-ribbon domain